VIYHSVPPSSGGWYKIIQTDPDLRGAETVAIISPEIPSAESLVKAIVEKLNRGPK
jgi:hypothetical protein